MINTDGWNKRFLLFATVILSIAFVFPFVSILFPLFMYILFPKKLSVFKETKVRLKSFNSFSPNFNRGPPKI